MFEPTGEYKKVYEITGADLDRLVSEVSTKILDKVQGAINLATEKPMNAKQAANFLGLRPDTVYKKVKRGVIRCNIDKDGTMWFFASEIVEGLKGKKPA